MVVDDRWSMSKRPIVRAGDRTAARLPDHRSSGLLRSVFNRAIVADAIAFGGATAIAVQRIRPVPSTSSIDRVEMPFHKMSRDRNHICCPCGAAPGGVDAGTTSNPIRASRSVSSACKATASGRYCACPVSLRGG